MDTPAIETGNLGELDTGGSDWVVGFGGAEGVQAHSPLRSVGPEDLARGPWIKWARHAAGDPGGGDKPVSVGRTLSVLVSPAGLFRVELSRVADFSSPSAQVVELRRPGDYVIWGAGWHHRWTVVEDCTIMTVRWEPAAD